GAPAHRPVHFPCQFALYLLIEAKGALIVAEVADIRDRCCRLVILRNRCRIFMTVLTIDAERIVGSATLFESFLLSRQGLGAGENIKDLQAPCHRLFYLRRIVTAAIRERLTNEAWSNT